MPRQGQLSPQQVQSLLEAMNNQEEKVQDKINAKKLKGVPIKKGKKIGKYVDEVLSPIFIVLSIGV